MTRESFVRENIRKQELPYGQWGCGDGRQVLFNRFYRPIWQRLPSGEVVRGDRDERVPFVSQKWFYSDATKNKAATAIPVLEAFTGQRWNWRTARSLVGKGT